MNFLAFDYGRQKIGLAVSLDSGLSEPLLTVRACPWDKFLKKITNIIKEQRIEHLVIGLPEGPLVPEIKKFAQKLNKITQIPCSFQSESLTTHEAIAKMKSSGQSWRQIKKKEDAVAAALILKDYLESQYV